MLDAVLKEEIRLFTKEDVNRTRWRKELTSLIKKSVVYSVENNE